MDFWGIMGTWEELKKGNRFIDDVIWYSCMKISKTKINKLQNHKPVCLNLI